MVVQAIKKDSDEEKDFINEITNSIRNLNRTNIEDKNSLLDVTSQLSLVYEKAWTKYAKPKRITKHSKEWWNQQCMNCLNTYRQSGDLEDWKSFKARIREAKRQFFEDKIHEIASSNKHPWDLMSWVKKKALLAISTITYEGQPCNTLPSLWNTLHNLYNSAANRPVNTDILNHAPQSSTIEWPPFSKQEFRDAIAKCSSSSTPGPDHVSWRHLKPVIADDICLERVVDIANACIKYETWPHQFKASISVVIPKPNKDSYNTPKSFRPIVLLNTTGKLVEKVISTRLQYYMTANGFLDPNQLGGIRQQSTTDTGLYLTYIIRAGWLKQCHTSVIAFDIAQFFPSLNHSFLAKCLSKASLNASIINFFNSYHANRTTTYTWNGFSSPSFNTNVGVGQGSALSPIISAMYMAPIIKTFKKRINNLKEKIPSDIFSFVDDGLLISQEKSYELSSAFLLCSYNIMSKILSDAGLVMEHSKSEIFYFTQS